MRRFLLLLPLPFLLSACVTAAISAGTEVGVSIAEERSIGRKIDDKLIYTDILNQYAKADKAYLVQDININTRFGRVMLTGTVAKEQDMQDAVALAWKAKGVSEVINEIVVDPKASMLTTANDSLVKRNLEARLLITKDVWLINYSFDVQNGVAYIIGRVKNQGELDRVLSVARTTKGVKRVVSHLQVNADTRLPTAAAGQTQSPAPVTNYTTEPADSAPVDDGTVYTGPVSQESTRPAPLGSTNTVSPPDSIDSKPVSTPAR